MPHLKGGIKQNRETYDKPKLLEGLKNYEYFINFVFATCREIGVRVSGIYCSRSAQCVDLYKVSKTLLCQKLIKFLNSYFSTVYLN